MKRAIARLFALAGVLVMCAGQQCSVYPGMYSDQKGSLISLYSTVGLTGKARSVRANHFDARPIATESDCCSYCLKAVNCGCYNYVPDTNGTTDWCHFYYQCPTSSLINKPGVIFGGMNECRPAAC